MLKADGFGSHGINVRRGFVRIAVTAQVVRTGGVHTDQDNMPDLGRRRMPVNQYPGDGYDQRDDNKTDYDFKILHTYLFGIE
jgi:hypothetical protein